MILQVFLYAKDDCQRVCLSAFVLFCAFCYNSQNFLKNLFKINTLPFLTMLCLFSVFDFGNWEILKNQGVISFLVVVWLQFPKFGKGGQKMHALKDAAGKRCTRKKCSRCKCRQKSAEALGKLGNVFIFILFLLLLVISQLVRIFTRSYFNHSLCVQIFTLDFFAIFAASKNVRRNTCRKKGTAKSRYNSVT